jgi:hypothetical protein
VHLLGLERDVDWGREYHAPSAFANASKTESPTPPPFLEEVLADMKNNPPPPVDAVKQRKKVQKSLKTKGSDKKKKGLRKKAKGSRKEAAAVAGKEDVAPVPPEVAVPDRCLSGEEIGLPEGWYAIPDSMPPAAWPQGR